jgi:hypothetical protein
VQNVGQTELRIVVHSLLSQTGHLGLFLQLQPAYAARFNSVATLYGIGPVAIIIAMITGGKSIVQMVMKRSIVPQTSGAPPLQRHSGEIAR